MTEFVTFEKSTGAFTEAQQKALKHAAEISEFVTERSIGPDLEEWFVRSQKKPQKSPIIPKSYKLNTPQINPEKTLPINTFKENKNATKEEFDVSKELEDIDVLNTSLEILKFEEELQRESREHMQEFRNRQVALVDEISQKQNELEKHRQKCLQEKRHQNELLEKLAEEQAKADSECLMQEIEKQRQHTQLQLQSITYQGILISRNEFALRYNAMVRIVQSAPPEATEAVRQKLRDLVEKLDKLHKKVATGNFLPGDLKTAESLCISLKQMEKSLYEAIESYARNNENEQKLAIEAEKQRQEKEKLEQQKKVQEEQAAQAAVQKKQELQLQIQNQQQQQNLVPTPAANKGFHPARAAWYQQIQIVYTQKVESVKPLQTDDNCKKYRNICQRAINVPLNAISASDSQHLRDKFDKLYAFITGQPFRTADAQISINDHPLARDYCLLLMAKKFVNQGETTVSSNPQAAFAFATVIVSLWQLLPDFGHCFLAYVFKESPFLIPHFVNQAPGQSPDDYFKQIGYRLTDTKELEKPDIYLKRQAGIARLYGAVMITPGRRTDQQQPHPYGIAEAWRWLTHTMDLEPLPEICATIISEILPIVGPKLWRTYRNQFAKLLIYMQKYYFPRLNAIGGEGGPKTRLELILNNALANGRMEEVVGAIAPGFW